jgi:hypothetical protein
MNKLICCVALAFAVVATAACGGEKVYLRMQNVDTADVHVVPTEIMISGAKLWVKIMVTNGSQGTLLLQRDQITCHVPNGMTLTRAVGTWGHAYGAGYAPYILPPGAMHPVYIEFEEQGFKWKDMPSAQIDFNTAITKDGQPVAVPPFTVSR